MRVVLFTLALANATALVFGIVPALQATRPSAAAALKDEAGSIAGGSRQVRMRRLLVVGQVAMSMILLAGAAYEAWTARRGPGSDALAVTVAGTPVTLAADGTFDVTVPPAGDVVVVVSTAAGEATAVRVP